MTARAIATASFRGLPAVAAHASPAELSVLAGSLGCARPRDTLECWCLIALRVGDGMPGEVHALGWRAELMNTWITSPIVRFDPTGLRLATRSGHIYTLGIPAAPDLCPELRRHLAYALRTWGFEDVST